jgi:THO complex subunit 2
MYCTGGGELDPNKERTTATWFLETCILPRCKFSAADALFCAKFAYLLQRLQTPNFSFLEYCAMVLTTIAITITTFITQLSKH